MDDFESDHCPVCHKPVVVSDVTDIPDTIKEHYKEHIHVPGEEVKSEPLTVDQQQYREQIRRFLDDSRPPGIQLENITNGVSGEE